MAEGKQQTFGGGAGGKEQKTCGEAKSGKVNQLLNQSRSKTFIDLKMTRNPVQRFLKNTLKIAHHLIVIRFPLVLIMMLKQKAMTSSVLIYFNGN